MHSFALKKTAFAVLIALGAGVALAADNLTVEKGQTQTDDAEKTYGALTVEGTYINANGNSVTADSVKSSGNFTNNGTFTAGSFEVSGGSFANSGTLNSTTLSLSSKLDKSVAGTIKATKGMTFHLNGYDQKVGDNLVLDTPHLMIDDLGSENQAGVVFSNQKQIDRVDEITVTSHGDKTGLLVAEGASLSFNKINLNHDGEKNEARVEVYATGSVTIDTLTATGTKGMVQTNAGASATIHNVHVGEGTVFNLQTNGSGTADDKTGSFDISNVYVEKGGNFRVSVYKYEDKGELVSTPPANITSDALNITLSSGAIADFGGWKEEGNTDWNPDYTVSLQF